MTKKIVVTDPRQKELISQLRERAPGVTFVPVEEESLPEEIVDAEVLLGRISGETLARADNLRWVHVNSAGVDYLPLDQLREKGVMLTNGRGIHADTIGDHVMAFALAHSREILVFHDRKIRGVWDRECSVRELRGLTMGIVGTGGIGAGVAKRARSFGMKILGVNRSGQPVEGFDRVTSFEHLDRVIEAADYLVLACPLTGETRGLIGPERLRLLGPGGFLINIARGEVVDEAALADALTRGDIAGAGLDVFEEEPLPEDSTLWKIDSVMITPHVAGRQSGAAQIGADRFLRNLESYLEGRGMDWLVDYDKGY